MTNKIAIWLGLFVIAGLVADLTLADGSNLLFLSKKFFALLDWVAFWR
ncbi:glyceraldehyde-3-phosphate dehydrogenase [Pseudophaeobacter leonis]|nr:glyceraldehyde-3-phosphate dehydrogenase [Pseudophaeobacter leonis]